MAETSPGMEGAPDRIRETAKWLVVGLAAIATVAAGGLQLSSIGALDAESSRFRISVAGATVAALGAAILLVAASRVLTAPAVSLRSVAAKTPAGADDVVTDETLLQGHASVAALRDKYVEAVNQRDTAYAAYLQNTADQALRSHAEAAATAAVFVDDTAAGLLRVVSYQALVRRWRNAQIAIIVGGVLGGAGIGAYAWAANPPAEAVASSATPSVLTAPTPSAATLTPAGVSSLGQALGSSCDTSKPIPVLLLARTDAGPDLVVDTTASSCARIRFILGADWGTVRATG